MLFFEKSNAFNSTYFSCLISGAWHGASPWEQGREKHQQGPRSHELGEWHPPHFLEGGTPLIYVCIPCSFSLLLLLVSRRHKINVCWIVLALLRKLPLMSCISSCLCGKKKKRKWLGSRVARWSYLSIRRAFFDITCLSDVTFIEARLHEKLYQALVKSQKKWNKMDSILKMSQF